MKRILITLIALFFTYVVNAQEFEVPENVELKKASDYTEYEQDVISGFNWLMQTPLDRQKNKRKQVNAFLLKWMTGSPDVSIEIKPEIVNFMDASPELLIIFMGAWTKYAIENKDYTNKIAGNLAGLEAVIKFYTKNKEIIGKEKHIEKYIKMKADGKLKEFVEKNA